MFQRGAPASPLTGPGVKWRPFLRPAVGSRERGGAGHGGWPEACGPFVS